MCSSDLSIIEGRQQNEAVDDSRDGEGGEGADDEDAQRQSVVVRLEEFGVSDEAEPAATAVAAVPTEEASVAAAPVAETKAAPAPASADSSAQEIKAEDQ